MDSLSLSVGLANNLSALLNAGFIPCSFHSESLPLSVQRCPGLGSSSDLVARDKPGNSTEKLEGDLELDLRDTLGDKLPKREATRLWLIKHTLRGMAGAPYTVLGVGTASQLALESSAPGLRFDPS